jgi:HK97 family phage major capsid protein
VYCSRFQPNDSRVVALQEMNTGGSGGLPIPDEFNPVVREVTPQEAIFRPRCPVMPAGDAPDADLVLPALNQVSSNMYGGVEVAWTAEGGEKPDTTAALREVRWTPHEVSGSIVVTDKLLRNWRAAGPFLETLLRRALLAAEDVAFLSANGIGRPLGALKSPCLKSVNRATANTVKYADLVGMEAEILEDQPAVWVVNPRVIPKLRLMEDTEGHLIWQENARDGGTPTLLGRPVIKNFRSPALGTKGDVLLANFAHYVIKDGASLRVQASEHVYFKNNKTVIKAFQSVGGSPWLDAPVKQEDGQTYSPFVALDVPA